MNAKTKRNELSPALRAWLDATPAVTERDLQNLRDAGKIPADDPAFQADYPKSLFIEKMLAAMKESGVTQTELAGRRGKSRQYSSKLLNEHRRINFTIETMCEFAHLLGRRVEIQVLGAAEALHVVRAMPPAGGGATNGAREQQQPAQRAKLSRAA